MFTTEPGSPLRPDRVPRRFRELTAQAGLPPIRLHDLRHGSATLPAAGTHVEVVQETLGHSRVSTTPDVYTSVLPELFHESALGGRGTGTTQGRCPVTDRFSPKGGVRGAWIR